MMYCNFSNDYIADGLMSIKNIKDVKILYGEESVLVAVVTYPLFKKSDIDELMTVVKNTAGALTDKPVFVTRNMEIFCDIINNLNNEKNCLSYDQILSKLRRYENV